MRAWRMGEKFQSVNDFQNSSKLAFLKVNLENYLLEHFKFLFAILHCSMVLLSTLDV
jgi:hypothetical protein